MLKIKGTLIALWWAGFCLGQEQPIAFQSILDSALSNSPALQAEALNQDRADYAVSPLAGLGPLNLQYSYGQLDGTFLDYQWQVTQRLGNPVTGLKNLALDRVGQDLARQSLRLSQARLKADLATAYASWYHQGQILARFAQVSPLIAKAKKTATAQLTAGQIDALQYQKILKLSRQIAWEEQQHRAQKREALRILSNWSGLNLTSKQPYPPQTGPLPSSDSLEQADLIAQVRQLELRQAELKLEQQQAEWAPNFSIGYINQQLNGVAGLEGVLFGAQIPLFQTQQHQKAQIARVEKEQRSLRNAQSEALRGARLRDLLQDRAELSALLHDKNLSSEEKALASLQARLETGKIDPTDFLKHAQSILNAQQQSQSIAQAIAALTAEIQFLKTGP